MCTMKFHWSVLVFILAPMYKAAGQMNLTPEGYAFQSTTYRGYNAERALTPPASTKRSSGCSHTGDRQTFAWWSLRFAYPFFITTVLLYYSDNFAERINGFSLYVSNGTGGNVPIGGPVGFLCFKDPDNLNNQQFIFNIDCYTVGRAVVFYNTDAYKAFVELCYVEVHGCPLTKYGINCSVSCPQHCIDQHCFPGNGSCVLGCSSGVCVNNSCSEDGTCNIGCTDGQNGKYCDKNNTNLALYRPAAQGEPSSIIPLSVDGNRLPPSCAEFTESNSWIEVDIGFYGIIKAVYLNIIDTSSNQEKTYSIYCTNVSNSNEILLHNGQLPSHDIAVNQTICKYVLILPPNSALQICEIEVIGCHSGWYGTYCNMSCPEKCGGPCDLDTGTCTYGCTDGYTGTKCEKKCENGKYGSQCLRECSANCNSPPCDHVTGICVNGGCKLGWIGYNCTTVGVMTDDSGSSASIGAGVGVPLFVLIIILLSMMIYVRQRNSRNGISRGTAHTSEYENTPTSSYYTDLQNMNIDDRQETGYINNGTSGLVYDDLQPKSENGIDTKPEDTSNNKQNDTNVYESVANNKRNSDMVIYQNEIL